MGGRVDNLTKAPYLVLFVILISISVGTASALITITLAGNVHVTGDLDVDGEVLCPTCTLGYYHITVDHPAENAIGIGVNIPCDAGDTPIGGSFEGFFEGFINSQSIRLTKSTPSLDGDGWKTTVQWDSTAGVDDFIIFGVMCADHPPVHVP